MSDGMNIPVIFGPFFAPGPERFWDLAEFHGSAGTMRANQAAVHHIAGEKREQRRAATLRRGEGVGQRGQTFVPDIALVADFGRSPIGADQWMRDTPDSTFHLAECLRKPPCQ